MQHLQEFGYNPDHPLNRDEAARLLHELETTMQVKTAVNKHGGAAGAPSSRQTAFDFHARVMSLSGGREGDGSGEHHSAWALHEAVQRRQHFWMDACREPALMVHRSPQAIELYMQHGCLFVTPAPSQVQEILDALDASMQCWDRDYPQLFFQTLELNFPHLRARR